MDGSFRYSQVIHLADESTSAGIYPNPTPGPVRLSRDFAGKPFRVLSTGGLTVRSGRVPASGVVSLSGLPGGLYHLLLDGGAAFEVVKR